MIIIINKILLILFIMSILNMARHTYFFIQAVITTNDDEVNRYTINAINLWILGLSIGYFLTALITGIFIQ